MDSDKIYKLTNPQKSILLTEQYYKSTSINNVVGRIKFKEVMDVDLLKKTLEIIIEQNDALRTRIIKTKGDYYQYFTKNANNDVTIIDINNNEDKIVKELSRKYIPLINTNLMRFYILKYDNGMADVLSVSHHIVADAWTVSMYAKEIIRIYQKLKRNEDVENINYSYFEYIKEENDYLTSNKIDNDREYWKNEYQKEPTIQFFNTCNNIRGKREHYIIDTNKTANIKAFCKNNAISEQCLFMSAFAIYLSKISSSSDIAIGMPVLNRKNFKNKHTMGMFIETLPLCMNVDSNLKCKEFIKYINEKQFSFLKHHRYPYELLQKDIKNKFESNQKNYSVAFSYQNAKIENSEEMECTTSWEFNGYCPDDLQIHISDMQNTGTFNVYYDYKYNGIDKSEIKNIHTRLLYIIEQIINNANKSVKEIEIITEQEKGKIIYEFNNTRMNYENIAINQTITNLAKKYPNNIAVIDKSESITYDKLENKSNYLANILLMKNIKENDVVGILFDEKNINLIISILATLKTGASFILLYNGLPDDRIKFILRDSKATAIITDNKFLNRYNEILNINLDDISFSHCEPIELEIDTNKTAYLIYTSGTTGKPKGTEQTHKNLSNFIYSFYNILDKDINENDRFLSITNVSFDVSIAEIFTPLFFGATLYLYKDLSKTIVDELVKYIVDNKITFAYFPPSMLEEVADKLQLYKNNVKLNKMLVGVEPIKTTTLEKFINIKEDIHIINGYGPSETTICSTMYDFSKRKDNEEIVPIGTPIKNTEIYIMNTDQNMLPINTNGEIYILGDGVGKGYKFNKELTREKYIEINGKKAFKTGDIGKWTTNGNIIFSGRNDNQIKFRGYRIDLGEIENTLKSCNEVKNAKIILDKENFREEKLIAFVILKNKNMIEETLRDFLSKTLPYYMLPSNFIKLDVFPINANGKIDNNKLIEIALEKKEKIIMPKTDIEKLIYKIIKKKTKDKEISIDDNFFDLGIDSLEAISLIVEFEKENIQFSLQDFYNYPSIRLLANKINTENIIKKSENKDYIKKIDNNKSNMQTIEGNILLLGGTGFLGSHILEKLLTYTNIQIYCLVRASSKNKAKTRLKERLLDYFDEEFYEKNEERIIAINGDFTQEQFGMNSKDFELIKKDISMIINSAACVKHFGSSEYFYSINYLSVKKALEFCKKENKQFIQISTMSVFEGASENAKINESTLYCNQDLENIYIKTKFEAEQAVIKAIMDGTNATIFRLGNIMWRTDGKFQINENENAFINKLKMIIEHHIVLSDILNYTVDLSPVDLCAEAIVKILLKNKMNIYHIENGHKISIKDLVDILNNMGFNIKEVEKETYKKEISSNIQNKNNLIALLENNTNKKNINSEQTIKHLKNTGFEWNNITEEYIRKYILNI